MARINIEDCWWSDPRRTQLLLEVGYEADAAVVNMWRAAQEFWGKGRSPMPSDVFFKLKHAQALIDAGLASLSDDKRSVYVRGSSAHLNWHAEKREQAKAAGKKSAEARRQKSGTAQPQGGKTRKISEREPNENRTVANGTEPSDSYSGSDSDSGSVSLLPVKTVSPKPTKAGAFIVGYKSRFNRRWGVKVNVEGKDAGIAKRVAERLSYDEIEVYLDAFFSIPDAELVKKKHPMFLFEAKLNEIGVFAQSGEFHTQRQAIDADNSAANAILLEKVRRGEL